MNTLYITEPDALNVRLIRDLMREDWKIIEGDVTFSGLGVKDCTTLIIRSATTVTSSITDTFPNLRNIVRVGVGVDNIDIDFCNRRGIAVYNSPGANADAVSDYVIGMMFHALRNIHLLSEHDVKHWNRFKFTGRSMAERTIGIIGFGNIGRQIFSKLGGHNCKEFFVYDPFIKKDELPPGVTYVNSIEEVLENSDIVTLHVPLLPTTKYIINKTNLGLMAEGSILINASRGGIVNEADVIDYARDHDLTYVADTVEGEPNVSGALLGAANVIITPHIASLTKESDDNMIAVAIENFLSMRMMNQPAR